MSGFRSLLATCVTGCALLAAAAQASPSPNQIAVAQIAADAGYCQSWHDRLSREIADFNGSCSGALDPATHASCLSRKTQINAEVAQFNSQCAG